MGAAAVEGAPPPDTTDVLITIKALKMRLKDQERRLAELETEQIAQQRKQAQKEAIREVIKEMDLNADRDLGLPKWMDNLKFSGDLRLRYQGECFSGRTRKTRNRGRFRLRFGVKKTWLEDQMEVGFRLASGSNNDPTSTNQSFDGSFSEKNIWIDRAYAKYSPKWLKGFTIIGGKMAKPMVHTDLVWDSDVNPEGVWGQYKHTMGPVEPVAGAGYFVVEEVNRDHDTIFVNDDGDLAAGQFHMINLTNKVGFKAFGLPMSTYFDWVHNCGDKDGAEGYDNQSDGYAVGLKVGKNKKQGDWSCGYKYAYIEANAAPGEFNDSDFGHANRKGHVWGAKYNLTDSLTVGTKVFWTEPVTGDNQNERDTTVQADLVWKF
jgi:hypothetical protein